MARSAKEAQGRNPAAGRPPLLWILLPLLLAAAVRCAYLPLYARSLPFYRSPLADARIYHDWARAIVQGDWLSRAEGVFYRAPFYPYFLAVVDRVLGGPVPWVPLLQILFSLAAVLLAGRLAAAAAGPRAAGWTMLLLGLYGPLVAVESKLLSTACGLFLQTLLLWLTLRLFARPRPLRALAAGLALGALTLVRPQALVFAPVLPLLLWKLPEAGPQPRTWSRPPAALWLYFLLGLALLVFPVALRNRLVGNDWVLVSSNGGMTFFQGNNEENHSGLLTVVKRFDLSGSAVQQRVEELRAAEKEVGHPLTASQSSAFWTRQGLAFITGHPLGWLALEARKLYRILTSYEYADNYSFYIERERLFPLRLALATFGLLLSLGILGALLGAGGTPAGRLALAAAAVGLLGCLAFYVSSRYRMEAVPGLAVLGGIALARLPGPRAWTGQLRLKLLLASSIFLATFLPPGAPARSQESITYIQMGNAFEAQKRFPEAEAAYRQAVRERPVNAFAWSSLALLVARLRDAAEADSLLSQAPAPEVTEHPLALYTLGYLLIKLGRDDEAIGCFQRSIQGSPFMKEPRYHLALLYEKKREYGRALEQLETARDLDPRDADLVAHLAYVRLQLRRYAEARTACRDLLALRPGDADATLNLAVASFYLHDLAEAGKDLDGLLEKAPAGGQKDPLALYYRGLVRLRTRDRAGASTDLEEVLRQEPENRRALCYLSQSRLGPGEGAAAWAGLRPLWLQAYGSGISGGLLSLQGLLESRARSSWGDPLSPGEEAACRSLSAEKDCVSLAEDLRRFIQDEGREAEAPPAPDAAPPTVPSP